MLIYAFHESKINVLLYTSCSHCICLNITVSRLQTMHIMFSKYWVSVRHWMQLRSRGNENVVAGKQTAPKLYYNADH